jgi:hypothetical protein
VVLAAQRCTLSIPLCNAGILEEVKNEIYKAASIQLCSNVTGQIAVCILAM